MQFIFTSTNDFGTLVSTENDMVLFHVLKYKNTASGTSTLLLRMCRIFL